MQWLFIFFIAGSFVFACICGKMDALSTAALQSCGDGVKLTFTLLGSMGFWSGIMKIAEESGLTAKITRLLQKPIRMLFCGLRDPIAIELICMNITANLLGLGNAATPTGLRVMKRLDALNRAAAEPSFHMMLFVVLNTASLQLIPTTVAYLRGTHGSNAPFGILPATLLTSLCALITAIGAVYVFGKKNPS